MTWRQPWSRSALVNAVAAVLTTLVVVVSGRAGGPPTVMAQSPGTPTPSPMGTGAVDTATSGRAAAPGGAAPLSIQSAPSSCSANYSLSPSGPTYAPTLTYGGSTGCTADGSLDYMSADADLHTVVSGQAQNPAVSIAPHDECGPCAVGESVSTSQAYSPAQAGTLYRQFYRTVQILPVGWTWSTWGTGCAPSGDARTLTCAYPWDYNVPARQPFGHSAAHNASNNHPQGQTPDPGYLIGHANLSGDTKRYLARGELIQWTNAAVTWIRANQSGFGSAFRAALVFHAFRANSETCANASIISTFSNLPGGFASTKSTCGGPNNETRLYAGDPNGLSSAFSYVVDATYQDADAISLCNEINIDNYWVQLLFNNTLELPQNRDNMGKFYYRNGAQTSGWGAVQTGNCP